MARSLSLNLEEIVTGETSKIQPAWTVEVFDVRSGYNSVSDIVSAGGAGLDTRTGPFDITEYVSIARGQENAGDYLQSGVAASVVLMTIQDPGGVFDPDLVITDPDALGRFFRRGNVIKIRYGDERLDDSQWVGLFFGLITGQAGYARGRAPLVSELTIKALGREASFMGLERTSDEFSNSPVVTYLEMAENVATEEMGLVAAERNLFGFGNRPLRHASVTLAKESPMSMLAKIMFVDGFLPKFNGDGVLEQTNGFATNSTDRFYPTSSSILSISRPRTETQPPDTVCVIGLDYLLTRVDQPRQVVAEASVTTGYFTSGEEIEVYWSEDKTQLVDNVVPRVIQSVNGGMNAIGGGEEFELVVSPSTNSIGTVGVVVTIDTGGAPWLGTFLLATYVALAGVPDAVIASGVFVVAGSTISVGRLAQAIALSAGLFVMTKIGRGQYLFEGDPFEFVYSEIRECAKAAGVSEYNENAAEILNHLVDNRTDCKNIAREVLFRQQALARERNVSMVFDPGLEPDDVFELIEDGRRFLVESVAWTLKRESKSAVANVKCGEVTDDIARAT